MDDEIAKGTTASGLVEILFPGDVAYDRKNNVPQALYEAKWRNKRLIRSETAKRIDALDEESMKYDGIKYFDWVDEPGACKICSDWAAGGPYPLGEKPQVVVDSHPNCRCRRIPSIENNDIKNLLVFDLKQQYAHYKGTKEYAERMAAAHNPNSKRFGEEPSYFDKISPKELEQAILPTLSKDDIKKKYVFRDLKKQVAVNSIPDGGEERTSRIKVHFDERMRFHASPTLQQVPGGKNEKNNTKKNDDV